MSRRRASARRFSFGDRYLIKSGIESAASTNITSRMVSICRPFLCYTPQVWRPAALGASIGLLPVNNLSRHDNLKL